MEYTHQTRIGNEGDVVKHAILARLISGILENRRPESFDYAETHSGRAEYRLPSEGRWRYGIGKLSEKLIGEAAVGSGSGAAPYDNKLEGLDPYIETCFAESIRPGSLYPGSSGIVFKLMRKAAQRFTFRLLDVDAAVCHSLLGFYENWPEVSICRGDGYEGLHGHEDLSFVLVDPVAIDTEKERILSTLESLSRREVPFLCWTALVQEKEPLHREFKEATQDSYSVHWASWRPMAGETYGCQITVSRTQGALVRATLNALGALMGWHIESF
ncbi:MAG: hypothetical protein V2B18_03520 [Pseudomonadota bacterium]